MDRVQKIRAEIERQIEELQPCNTRENLRAHGAIAGYYQILSFIDSMQEEPVKIKKGCKYRCLSDMVNIDTGNISFIEDKIYLAPKDNTLVSEENGWLCDTSEDASNFELVEEPKECMYSKDNYTDEDRKVLCDGCEEECEFNKKETVNNNCLLNRKEPSIPDIVDEHFYEMLGEEPVSDELEEAAKGYATEGDEISGLYIIDEEVEAFKAGAKWGENQAKVKIQAQSMALAHGCPKESVSEDLEEASKGWLRPQLDKSYAAYGETKQMELTHFDGYAMLDAIEFGAEWQKQKDKSKVLTEEQCRKIRDDAFELGKDAMKQQMMAKAIDGEIGYWNLRGLSINTDLPRSVSEGDKVKIIVIKED